MREELLSTYKRAIIVLAEIGKVGAEMHSKLIFVDSEEAARAAVVNKQKAIKQAIASFSYMRLAGRIAYAFTL